ncbi:hypothetical protein FRB93_010829 [Tulasnella sp. JGI-2019a]|nr:hypothetical protein FRB93_010829 [Tulasnella sp. JGI-2019a]
MSSPISVNLSRFFSLSYDRHQLGIMTVSSLVAYVCYKALTRLIVQPYYSVLRDLPGPEVDSYIWGHMKKIFNTPAGVAYEEWVAQYGPTFQYRGIGLSRRFFTLDPKAIAHIVNHPYDYPKPTQYREFLEQYMGKGVLVAEGADHRRQRKIMNPCFGTAQIRGLMPIFYTKAFELRDIWLNQMSEHSGETEVDALEGLSRATLDVIGLAGFNYDFNALVEGETNELANAFHGLVVPTTSFQVLAFLQYKFPLLKLIPTERGRAEKKNLEVMNRVGRQLVQKKKAALLQETIDGGEVVSKDVVGRDLLSVLARANMASDIKDSEKMMDEEMMGQITTMLLAGHETTSTSAVWLLYDLAKPQNKAIQDKLRAELWTLSSEQPSMEELNVLPYLDAVIKENLRLSAAVPALIREAARDDVIPLSVPIVDRKGIAKHQVRVNKGDSVYVSIIAINRDKGIWGDDAHEFNPERWFKPETHPSSSNIPSVYSDIMTFIGGPRHCIGYRFALMEMKAIVFALVRNMAYSLPNPAPKLGMRSAMVSRPTVILADGTKKNCMPLIVKAVGGD